MDPRRWLMPLCLVAVAGCSQDTRTVVHMAGDLESRGRFREAAAALERAASTAETADSLALVRELERLRRIRLDYPYTDSVLYADLRRRMADLPWHTFSAWVAEGRFDTRTIDDTLRFFALSRRNLFWRFPHLNALRQPVPNDSAYEHRLLATVRAITAEARRTGMVRVLPMEFVLRMRVGVDEGVVPAGELVRAWLPVPRDYPHQSGFQILSADPPPAAVDDGASPIRSAYFERRAGGGPVNFELGYRYTAWGVRFPMRPEDVTAYVEGDTAVERYTGEAPHVRFTRRMREASRHILGEGDPNPLRRARRIFNWITENFLYSHAEEYSTLRNISEYTLERGRGDCGQLALLYITLCRMNGIPARWQSGWWIFPGSMTIHDWAEIYLHPYGWVPVDPNMGMEALRYHTTLTWEERREVRDFFFGGLDQYRMAANAGHAMELRPTKAALRSDDVDFQRGEVEFGRTNVYFTDRSYDLDVQQARVLP